MGLNDTQINTVEKNKPLVVPVETPVVESNLKSLKDLQKIATEMGFVGVEVFTTKAQVLSVIESMAKTKIANKDVEPEKAPEVVATFTENQNWQGKRERTEAYMKKQPTIRTMIPLGINEKMGASEDLQINGYKITVPKGVFVNLPEPFVDLISYAYNQTAEAGKEFLLDRPEVSAETGRTVKEVLS